MPRVRIAWLILNRGPDQSRQIIDGMKDDGLGLSPAGVPIPVDGSTGGAVLPSCRGAAASGRQGEAARLAAVGVISNPPEAGAIGPVRRAPAFCFEA